MVFVFFIGECLCIYVKNEASILLTAVLIKGCQKEHK